MSSCRFKPFCSVPEPKRWPLLGHTHLFMPKIGRSCISSTILYFKLLTIFFSGRYNPLRMTEAMGDLELMLGPIFKLVLGGQTMLVVTRTEDVKLMFANEGKYPARPTFPALNILRRKLFGTGGIITELEHA